jgi:hypothetical protein
MRRSREWPSASVGALGAAEGGSRAAGVRRPSRSGLRRQRRSAPRVAAADEEPVARLRLKARGRPGGGPGIAAGRTPTLVRWLDGATTAPTFGAADECRPSDLEHRPRYDRAASGESPCRTMHGAIANPANVRLGPPAKRALGHRPGSHRAVAQAGRRGATPGPSPGVLRMGAARPSGARDLRSFGRSGRTPVTSVPRSRVRRPGCVPRVMVGLPARRRGPIPSARRWARPRSAGCSGGQSTWGGHRPYRRGKGRLPRVPRPVR